MQILSRSLTLPLHGVEATRLIEQRAAATLPPHTLMQRAGLAVAQLALALAPHARRIWVACGPGNNGGDGLEAAIHLHRWGKAVVVTWLGDGCPERVPADALASVARARAAGVVFADAPPADYDLAIDALLGIGATALPSRGAPAAERLGQWLALLQGSSRPVLAVDVPSGLNVDTGAWTAPEFIAAGAYPIRAGARFTLSLLTLKPGLFTARGQDAAGQIWWDDLGVTDSAAPDAWLLGRDRAEWMGRSGAAHASHKGSFGDVAILGGESAKGSHMVGAALLAARAALHAGAGRVFVALLGDAPLTLDAWQPELMFRSPDALDLKTQTVVCGCGGGDAVRAILPRVLSLAHSAVLDADALNTIAADPQLQTQLRARRSRGYRTVLTPHPLEAARLLGRSTTSIQSDRLAACQELAIRYACVVVLKGSGTVIASDGQPPLVNPTGNARLATAGTGDVLAGMLGAAMAAGLPALEAACSAVFHHGAAADDWPARHPGQALTASALARSAQDHQPDLKQQQQHEC